MAKKEDVNTYGKTKPARQDKDKVKPQKPKEIVLTIIKSAIYSSFPMTAGPWDRGRHRQYPQ